VELNKFIKFYSNTWTNWSKNESAHSKIAL
jgi:hypothetical protein